MTTPSTSLVLQLADEMAACWKRGDRPTAEQYLDRAPSLWQQPEAAWQLVYEEICLRQEYGEGDAGQVVARFPQWREQLQGVLDCHDLLTGPAPTLPAVGETVGEFRLVAGLGRGAVGAVFLAVQPALANRPVVLKVTPRAGQEHLSLARLQHTHVVPLYSARDDPARQLRILCMPYFGGASLARLLDELKAIPPARRTGRDLLAALDRVQAESPIALEGRRPGRDHLARLGYVEAACWIGACLADALYYAHERGLVHLDLKPANVLLSADGTPMLLDFHLARAPVTPGASACGWLGGTPVFMAPEQARALEALKQGRGVPEAIDARADIYSLARLLMQALGGPEADSSRSLRRLNPRVSRGLGDILDRCLSERPERRYPDAATLADDLRRHLNHLPLCGVANRSLRERWAKWRRRRPNAPLFAAALIAVVGSLAVAGDHVRRRYAEPRDLLHQGQRMVHRDPAAAVELLQRGRTLAGALPWARRLRDDLDQELVTAREGEAARRRRDLARSLHDLAEHVRFASVVEPLPVGQARELLRRCETIWEARGRLADPSDETRADLTDVAVLLARLRVRLAERPGAAEAREAALALLDDAEAACGPSPLVDQERRGLGQARPERPPRTPWERVALGRALLQRNETDRAADLFAEAIAGAPGSFWAHFYHGTCAYRLGRFALAAERFGTCIALLPGSAACYHNRGLARVALGEKRAASEDFRRALRLDPTLAAAGEQLGRLAGAP